MESWFYFAVLSTLFSGLHAFTHKVAAERGYGSGYFNAVSTVFPAFLGLSSVTLFVGWGGVFIWYGLSLYMMSAFVYLISANAKVDALKHYATASTLGYFL